MIGTMGLGGVIGALLTIAVVVGIAVVAVRWLATRSR